MMKGGWLLMVVLLAVLVGCTTKSGEVKRIVDSPIAVEANFEPGTDFSVYKTWNWIPAPQVPGQDPRTGDLDVTQDIQHAVGAEMFSRGYKRVDSAYDLIANFHLAVEDIDAAYINSVYDGQYPDYKMDMTGTADDNAKWQEGTLIIFFFDAKNGQLVWRGSAQAEVTDEATPEQREQRIAKAVKMMLEAIPGKKIVK
jgi:hypothetical protein